MSVIGRLWHPGLLEDRTLETLKTWLPTYLNEVSRNQTIYENLPALAAANPEADRDELIELLDAAIEAEEIKPRSLAAPKSWATVSEYDRFPEQGLPAIIVSAPGLADTPQMNGAGEIRADWTVEVSATVSANGARQTRRLAQMYLAAIQGAMLQRRSLGDPYTAVYLTDVQYADVPTERRRSIMAAAAAFRVGVEQMLSTKEGPVSPLPPDPTPPTWPDPPPDPGTPDPVPEAWPTISSTNVEIELEDI